MTHETNHAAEQAASQAQSISAMVSALSLDWDRLEELKDTLPEDLDQDEAEELAELMAAAGEYESQEDAERAIDEDPLSIEVRSGWHTPGEEATADEFCILLCTGGPAVRLVGDLNQHMEPESVRIEYQDWGTGWTEYNGPEVDRDDLLSYAQRCYFGR